MVLEFHPEVEDEITHRQLHDFHHEFMQLRKEDKKFKIGLPVWLMNQNAIRRGVYFFPAEGNEPPTTEKKVDTVLEEQYKKELEAFGIKT